MWKYATLTEKEYALRSKSRKCVFADFTKKYILIAYCLSKSSVKDVPDFSWKNIKLNIYRFWDYFDLISNGIARACFVLYFKFSSVIEYGKKKYQINYDVIMYLAPKNTKKSVTIFWLSNNNAYSTKKQKSFYFVKCKIRHG